MKTLANIAGVLSLIAAPLYRANAAGAIAGPGMAGSAGTEAKVVLWASNPLRKVFRGNPPPEKADTEGAFLEALRNEYEPAQICIRSLGFRGPVRTKTNPLLERAGGNSKEFAQLVKDLSGSEEDPESFYQIRHRLLLELNRLSQ